ncbi:MAG: hypothetical protein ACR2FE_10675 [Aeromicrobium sp.]
MWANLVDNPRRGRLVVGLFLLMFGVGALALPSLGRMSIRGVEILDVEFMRTSAKAAEQVARLGPEGVDAARISLYLDFPFLVLYAVALSAACIVVAARAADRGRTSLAAIGQRVAWLAPVAAACDALENIAILQVLADRVDQPWPAIAFGFAAVKFVLLAVVGGYLVVGLFLTLRRRESADDPA